MKKSFNVASGREESGHEESPDNVIRIVVSEKEIPAVLDSGTDISVVPRSVVPPVAFTGGKTRLIGFDGNTKLGDSAALSSCVKRGSHGTE